MSCRLSGDAVPSTSNTPHNVIFQLSIQGDQDVLIQSLLEIQTIYSINRSFSLLIAYSYILLFVDFCTINVPYK